jgi:hypothetical protein
MPAAPVPSPAPQRRAKIWVDLDRSGKRFVVVSPFATEFVSDLKQRIPYAAREWDKEKKLWCVDRAFWKVLRGLLVQHFGEESITYGPSAQAAIAEGLLDTIDDPSLESYIYLGVRSDAPACVVHAAYQAIELAYCEGAYVEAYAAAGCDLPLTDPTEGLPTLAAARAAYIAICSHRGIARVVPPGTCDGWNGDASRIPARTVRPTLAEARSRASRWPGWISPEERLEAPTYATDDQTDCVRDEAFEALLRGDA